MRYHFPLQECQESESLAVFYFGDGIEKKAS